MRRTIDAHDAAARASGARIVHTCGFDSIPSDLGVLALHEHAREHGLGDLEATTLRRRATRAAASAAARSTRCAASSTKPGATRQRAG